MCAWGGALPSGSPQPGRGRACWQVWCPNRADVRHLSWGTMGAHRRTNPERLPGGGSIQLKWKQRAGAVQVATKAKEVTEDPLPPCVSPPPHPHPLQPQNGEREALHRELGPGTRSVLISTVAAVALESPSQVHRQPITASTPPPQVARQAGITPNPQERLACN